jgi:SWI/SNF-related matrix-associated actin-dependent regulator of chromatin subfamily A member 5
MAGLYHTGMNGILADEMGLGKTLQSIAILAYLAEVHDVRGPHIVVVPKSTLANWMNEYKRWCPSLRTLRFWGSKKQIKSIIDSDFVAGQLNNERSWDVVVTTYEMCITYSGHLNKIPWQYLVLDEAHRVKNESSSLSKVLRKLNVNYRLLLTGTPLQNNLHELWALLNFLLPEIFHSSDAFDEWFNLTNNNDDENKKQLVQQLHKILKPFMLRRLKSDVEKDLLPKVETLLYTGFSGTILFKL